MKSFSTRQQIVLTTTNNYETIICTGETLSLPPGARLRRGCDCREGVGGCFYGTYKIETMRLKGADRTYGAPMLESIMKERFDEMPKDEQFLYFQLAEEFKEKMKNDWLLNLLCGYQKDSYNFYDIIHYKFIKELILSGNLYMNIELIPEYAFPDHMFSKNVKSLKGVGISIEKTDGNSDGLFSLSNDLYMKKIYPTAEETPPNDEADIIKIKKEAAFGVVEFGTTKICKSAMTLMAGDILLRVPYKTGIEYLKPCAAFFFNIGGLTKPKTT